MLKISLHLVLENGHCEQTKVRKTRVTVYVVSRSLVARLNSEQTTYSMHDVLARPRRSMHYANYS